MSSCNAEPKMRAGDDLQNLTLQWGYQQNTETSNREAIDWDQHVELGRNILKFLNPIFCTTSMVAGGATTITAIAWLSGLLVF